MSIEKAWQNWIDWEHEFQGKNLESIRQFPTTALEDLSDGALGSVSRAFFDPRRNRLYAGVRYPGVVAHIASISTVDGSLQRLRVIKGPMILKVTSPAFDPDSGTFFYTADNAAYRDLMSLNLETGEATMLMRDTRIGDIVINPTDRSIWGLRHLNGIVTLVRVPYPYDEWDQVYSFPYGEVPFDLDISPDGKLISASFGDIGGNQSLRIMNVESLLEGDATPVSQFDFGLAIPEGFVFSPDGRFLFGSAYFTGVSNIFRYELATGDVEAVSNVETGLFRPIPMEDGSLIAFRYSGEGFVPTRFDPVPLEDVNPIAFLGTEVIRKHPQLQEWQVGPAADIPLDDLITHEGPYIPTKNMELESIYPILEGYKDSVALGLNTVFSDPLMLDRLGFSASYSPDSDLPSDERLHLNLEYRHTVVSNSPLAGTWNAGARYNFADFYDLFGPTKRSLKGQWFFVEYDKTLIYDGPRRMDFNTALNHYTNLDRLPRYQNVDATFDQLTTLEFDLGYEHMRSSLGHVDDEKGFKWRTFASADHVNAETIPKFLGEFDFGIPLWWGNSSIWFRNSAGFAVGETLDEFANFFFGGFGNNYVDSREVKRYREFYAMPGFEINEIFGRNFFRSMVEFNLPPIRFRRVGSPGFYLTWMRPAIFTTALVTNLDGSDLRQDVYNVGGQLDLQFTMLSRLDMMLSFGYAVARGRGAEQSEEFMLSLKIL
jgi:hypothetical protein